MKKILILKTFFHLGLRRILTFYIKHG
uniref:Uncharacterized protein n=1 Tax=Anguilla anguilla TaxID=7936 RepID=A0A0E9RWZ4_ANGAN